MTDYINQGKGNVVKIWKTNKIDILSKIHTKCFEYGESFYNPSKDFREKILKDFNLRKE